MGSRFQAAVLVSAPCYPNAVTWSEENLLAVASGNIVTILNPAKPSGAGSRGVISILPSKPFPIGVINAGGVDFLSGPLLPIQLSRDTRPCVRSISWSPAGLASNAGCLLAVCTTGGRVKLYRFPFCEISAEWIEVMDISEMMYTYLSKINFGESQIISSESVDVTGGRDYADHKCPNEPPLSSLRKERKRRRHSETYVVSAKEPNNVKENNTWQIVPMSVSEGTPSEIKECDASLIIAQQYASRNAMLTPLVVAWSPILRTSANGVDIPHNSWSCCSILAIGLKCGVISFWRIDAPECYSIINTELPCKASNVGLLKAHDTWITSINWALYGSEISKPQLCLATGSSNGRVKIWQVNITELLKSSETFHSSFSLLKEVATVDSAPVSVLSFTASLQTPLNLLLAIGKGSGSLEVWTINMPTHEFEIIGCYSAHDNIVTGLAWAFDGRCLYSCSQDNSMKAWILAEESLSEIHIPSNTPGLKSSLDVPFVYDSCFGLAVSPGNLAMAVACRFDSDSLNPMYQERTQKAAIEFLWIGGQQLDTSSNIRSDIDFGSFPGFPEEELIWWEKNILWSLSQFENFSGLLNIWDIVAALLSFKQSIPNYVEHILLKWLTSYFGSHFGIPTTFLSKASKILLGLSSRQLHLINVITRHVVLKNDEVNKNGKYQDMERLGSAIEEQAKVWMKLHLSCENELRKRLVGLSFSAILSLLSDSSMNLCEVGCWSPDEWPQLEQWISLHENIVEDDLKFLAAEIGEVEKSRGIFEYDEHCSFCSAIVPFESTEYAICSGVKCDNGVDRTHKLQRCSVSMRLCPTKYSWFCMCCQRRASKLGPLILFIMPEHPSNFKSFFESSAFKKSSAPCCPFCGILLQRLQPEYWFDGLQTFMRYICHKSWLGGWFMPQKKSYFALQLLKGSWVFGLDLALHCDIDVYQFKFFSKLIKEKVGNCDSVIIMTHEPNWLIDWYWTDVSGKNVTHLICDHLKGRCKLRMAGDLHHYMRHSYVLSEKPVHVQHLLVNGCGALHPTHVFRNFNNLYGTSYESKASYPSFEDSSKIALGNILKFRKKNTIGGFLYFILAFSMFPQCKLGHILREYTFSGHLRSFFGTVWDAFIYMLGCSYISSAGAFLLLVTAVAFVPSKVSRKRRVIIGILHVSAHLAAALILMLLLELGFETCIRHKLLANAGYHTLYEWYRSVEREHFPDPTGLRARTEQWTFGLYPACIKHLMSAFDVPEAVTRDNICENGMDSLSRGGAAIYYASVFLYFWVFSTPIVSLIFGSYLYICINCFHIHFDEAFSSLRIANYKSFTRFHINPKGDLEVFALAVDKVPKEWKLDPNCEGESKQPQNLSYLRKYPSKNLSYLRKYPSKWRSVSFQQDPVNTVRIVDHFVIEQTVKPEVEPVNGYH